MKPSVQLLALTMGQGLSVGFSVTVAYVASRGLLTPPWAWSFLGAGLVTALIGGVASFFHMHHFAAARYILRRLKTSWLSREALTTGLYGGVLFVLALWTVLMHPNLNGETWVIFAWVVALFGLVALFVTAMLYATIPAMLSWHSPTTVLNFLALALYGGVTWALVLARLYHRPGAALGIIQLALVAFVLIIKGLQWHVFRAARKRVDPATGFGLPFAPYRLQDTGTTKPPYRTQTQTAPALDPTFRLSKQVGTILFLAVVPAVCTIYGIDGGHGGFALVGAVSLTIGLALERWLFFRDATHSSQVFFQDAPWVASRVAEPVRESRASMSGRPMSQ